MRQNARVEGSICKSYIEEETSMLFSHCLSDLVNISFSSTACNDEGNDQEDCQATLSIF